MIEAEWNPKALDLTNCDREPIHIPGSVQPYGVLVALREPDITVIRCSENTSEILGVPPQQILDKPLAALFGEAVSSAIAGGDFANLNPIAIGEQFYGIVHRAPGDQLVLEIEPALPEQLSTQQFYHNIQRGLRRLKGASGISQLCQVAAEEIRRLNGFDRVMIYQFDHHWNGAVVAEDKIDALEPYLNLHYPASDIPKQARELYRLNPIRLIHANDYTPAQMLSIEDDPALLDMSFAQLRSVSPIHLEYLQNMGVSASMSISILVEGELWGLVACHHTTSRIVSYDIRAACELLTQVFSLQLAERLTSELEHKKAQAGLVLNKLVEFMSEQEEEAGFISGLTEHDPNLLQLVEADGVAVYMSGQCVNLGGTPPEEGITAIVDWLQATNRDSVFYTDSLARLNPSFEWLRDTASGVLSICISHTQGDYILWFRAEQQKTVHWGGDPTKRATPSENGSEGRIHPRKSFAAWKQVIALESYRWGAWEVQIATQLRNIIVDTVLRLAGELRLRANILAKLNDELTRSNDELDSFAYIASHDLKEPLRGIHNYATFLLEDYSNILPTEGNDKLKTLVRLSQRMEDLINSLLEFSRVGRMDLETQPTDLNQLVKEALDMVQHRLQDESITIDVKPLPTLTCDPIRVTQVFNNLIANAIKYNDRDDKHIEIGAVTVDGQTALYVKDNGIGIAEKHHETVFRIFKRLHGRSQYGGGTGAGLTIVRKIVERHNGRIWLESTVEEGTTFFFTLEST